MNVLVACEESQTVCKAFNKLGHSAFSCDIQECTGGYPHLHIKGDVREVLYPNTLGGGHIFKTQDGGKVVLFSTWDLIIAHPPCTYLSVAGAANFPQDKERYKKQSAARDFFMIFYNHPCKHICIENPRAMKSANLPPYSQVIQPYDFGDDWSKQTLLWLKGLPPLMPNVIELNRRSAAPSWVGCHTSAKMRSKTFNGIAQAMAQQWGGEI